jgi:hypothetical protein
MKHRGIDFVIFGCRIVARVEMLQEHPRMGRVVLEFNQQDFGRNLINTAAGSPQGATRGSVQVN